MKKLVSLLLVMVMVASMFSLVGCPTPEPTTTTTTTAPDVGGDDLVNAQKPGFTLAEGETYDGSEVEITFSHTMGQNLQDVLNLYIAEFNELYPNITIVHSQVGSYDDVRTTVSQQIIAGEQPNIAYCYPDHVALYNLANAVVTLDQFINSTTEVAADDGSVSPLGMTQAQKDDFFDTYWAEGACYGDGLMYTLPLSRSTEVLYYNKTYFDANNLSVPTTWDDLEALCQRILEIEDYNPKCKPLGYDSEANWFITMCEQYGYDYTSSTGTKYLFNTPENKAFVKEFAEWYYEGYFTTQEIFKAYTSTMFVNTDKSQTYSYMSIGSSGGAQHQVPKTVDGAYPFEVGVAPIPQVDPSNPKAISQGPSLVILNNENRQEVIASYLFVEFITTSVGFQAEFSMESGYMPVIESVLANNEYSKWLNSANGTTGVVAQVVGLGIEMKDSYYISPAFTGSSVARDEVGLLMQNVFVNYGNCSTDADIDAMITTYFDDAIATCERKYPSKK